MFKNSELHNRRSQKRLEKASQYVNDLWFPVNSELLAKIKLGIRGGIYDFDPDSLIDSVSSDFSLFMYCLRELTKLVKAQEVTLPLANPVEALRLAGLDRLKEILLVEEQRISRHSFEAQEPFQRQRMEEMLISSSTAQALSASVAINEEIGFSAAILRQLGHTLIAWNYPEVYKEALSASSLETPLDHLITEKLGFSPTLLSVRVLMDWGMPLEMCEAVFLEEEDPDNFDESLRGLLSGSLAKICSVGEALARANYPESYPSAQHDWESAKQEIDKHLGENGMQFIQELLEENLENYVTFMPEIFNPGLILDPELHRPATAEAEPMNPYIELCTPQIAEALTELYKGIRPRLVNEKALSKLVYEVIPLSGYTGGLIYTIDPGISMLVPQTTIGTLRLRKKEFVDYSLVVSNADPISVAFRSVEPVIEFHADKDNEIYAAISGVIGMSNRVGILYLEIPYTRYISDERGFMTAFLAFSKAITDSLDLR